MVSGQAKMQCPFCKQHTIEAFHKPSYLEHSTSSISAGKKTTYFRVPESYEIVSGCEACGKSLKDVKDYFEGTIQKPHSERLKRLQDAGLPTKIVNRKD